MNVSTTTPALSDIDKLHGRIIATLSQEEVETLDFFAQRGRKFGVSVMALSSGEVPEFVEIDAQSEAERGALTKTNATVYVKHG